MLGPTITNVILVVPQGTDFQGEVYAHIGTGFAILPLILLLYYGYCLSGLYSNFLSLLCSHWYWVCYIYTIGTVFQGYTLIFSYTGHFAIFIL